MKKKKKGAFFASKGKKQPKCSINHPKTAQPIGPTAPTSHFSLIYYCLYSYTSDLPVPPEQYQHSPPPPPRAAAAAAAQQRTNSPPPLTHNRRRPSGKYQRGNYGTWGKKCGNSATYRCNEHGTHGSIWAKHEPDRRARNPPSKSRTPHPLRFPWIYCSVLSTPPSGISLIYFVQRLSGGSLNSRRGEPTRKPAKWSIARRIWGLRWDPKSKLERRGGRIGPLQRSCRSYQTQGGAAAAKTEWRRRWRWRWRRGGGTFLMWR